MRKRIWAILIRQELVFLAICAAIGAAIALNHGAETGLRTGALCFLVVQPVLVYVNRSLIKALWTGDL